MPAKADEVFAVRCFRGGKRRKTHTLTKYEARIFLAAAKTLSRFLKKNYKIGAA